MERNKDLERVAAAFVGEWTISLTNMWWEEPGTVMTASAVGEWMDDAFIRLRAMRDGAVMWDFVFGRSDANDRFVVLYYDERAVLRVFDMTLDDEGWEMARYDPDMHQRLSAKFDGDRMVGDTHASDDAGQTWRKDFDLTWQRVR